MKTRTILLVCYLLVPLFGYTQSGSLTPSTLDVQGMFLGGRYTKAQVEAIFGTPTRYSSNMSEFGLDEEYYYGENMFRFSDNGIFESFIVQTNDYVIFAVYNGGIRIGDPIDAITQKGMGRLVLEKSGIYRLCEGDDYIYISVDGNDKITRFSYMSSV